jgi:hypothetical protein
MKTFTQFITEVRLFTQDKKVSNPDHSSVHHVKYDDPTRISWYHDHRDTGVSLRHAEYQSTMPSGHHLYTQSEISPSSIAPSEQKHYAFNPKTKQVDMQVDGLVKHHANGSRTFRVGELSGREGSSIKAHDLYHHLITKHDHILRTDMHSVGGMKVWKKLSQKPDINVHGWNHFKDAPVNVRTHDDMETHVEPKTIKGKWDDNEVDISSMNLVAHKRTT